MGAVALVVAACNSDNVVEFRDEGELCLYSRSQGAPYVSGNPGYEVGGSLDVTVAMGGCFSGSCSEDERASCSLAVVNGTTFRVSSSGSYRDTTGEGRACTSECGFLTARCATPPLDAGTYTFLLGNEALTITIPSAMQPPCVGSPYR